MRFFDTLVCLRISGTTYFSPEMSLTTIVGQPSIAVRNRIHQNWFHIHRLELRQLDRRQSSRINSNTTSSRCRMHRAMESSNPHCETPANDRTQCRSWSPNRNTGANGRICVTPLESSFSATLALKKEISSFSTTRVSKISVSRSKHLLLYLLSGY